MSDESSQPTESIETDGGHHLPPQWTIKRWLLTTNHKDVGILYTITALFFLVAGGTLALLIRLQLWSSGEGILSGAAFNEVVTAHGLIMVFFFISPFAFGFANYVVPLQIGAKDLAFPRLNALSYWLYLFAGLLFLTSFFQQGTLDAGWTMYAPLTVPMYTPNVGGTTAILALGMFVIAVTASTINFLTSIHRSRAEGMRLRNLPMFTWSILLTVWMMLFAFAALLAALLILSSDRIIGTQYFAAAEGGALLWAHLFWFFGHPEVYIVFFPALGIMFETFQTFCGRRLIGRKWVIGSMILVALQSFLVWMHHMFLTAISLQAKTIFMATTIGISLPFDLMVFSLIYTMVKGKIKMKTPFLFSLGALLLFIIGGITGVFLGAIVLDYSFRGTYWVVAHFHYVMVGGATAMFGGLYYWYPKVTGRMYDEWLGKLHFGLYFTGFNLLYFPMFVVWETPRRVFEYATGFTAWHRLATIGAFILAFSFVVMFYNLSKSLYDGDRVGADPWAYSRTAEWAIPSPPPLENYPGIPSYADGSLSFESEEAATDGGTVTTEPAVHSSEDNSNAHAHDDRHEDHASPWPFMISLGLFVLFLGLSGIREGGTLYPTITGAGLVLSGFSLFGFGKERFYAPEQEYGERWLFKGVEKTKLGVWFFLASDVVVFGAVIGAFVFIRVSAGWSSWHPIPHDPFPGLVNTYILLTSSFTVILSMVAAERGNRRGLLATMAITFIAGLSFLSVKAWEWNELYHEGTTVSSSVQASTYYLTTGLHGTHVILGMLVLLFMMWRAWNGAYLGDSEPVEYFGLYWHFVDIVWVFLFPLFYIL